MGNKKLTLKQQRFVDNYIINLNATESAKKAGYSEKTAYSIGQNLLKNVEVKKAIDKRMQEKQDNLIAQQDEVLRYLTAVMRGESRATEIVIEGVGDGLSEAREMDKAPSEKERLKSAELLGKRYSLFTDKVEQQTDMDLNINVNYGEGD